MDEYIALLNKLLIFGTNGEDAVCRQTARELEEAALSMSTTPPRLNEECMSLCTDLLDFLSATSPATRAVFMFLANICLSDENRLLTIHYGIPGTCVLILQQHAELSTETLYYLFDLVSTLSSSQGVARQMLRPCIPYVLSSMEEHPGSLDVLLGGSFALHSLAMLDDANAELIAQRDGIQVLLNTFRNALRFAGELKDSKKRHSKSICVLGAISGTIGKQGCEERIHVCEDILRWCKTVLLQVCHCNSDVVGTRLADAQYGSYGENLVMDELKWTLVFEHKKATKKSLSVAQSKLPQ